MNEVRTIANGVNVRKPYKKVSDKKYKSSIVVDMEGDAVDLSHDVDVRIGGGKYAGAYDDRGRVFLLDEDGQSGSFITLGLASVGTVAASEQQRPFTFKVSNKLDDNSRSVSADPDTSSLRLHASHNAEQTEEGNILTRSSAIEVSLPGLAEESDELPTTVQTGNIGEMPDQDQKSATIGESFWEVVLPKLARKDNKPQTKKTTKEKDLSESEEQAKKERNQVVFDFEKGSKELLRSEGESRLDYDCYSSEVEVHPLPNRNGELPMAPNEAGHRYGVFECEYANDKVAIHSTNTETLPKVSVDVKFSEQPLTRKIRSSNFLSSIANSVSATWRYVFGKPNIVANLMHSWVARNLFWKPAHFVLHKFSGIDSKVKHLNSFAALGELGKEEM